MAKVYDGTTTRDGVTIIADSTTESVLKVRLETDAHPRLEILGDGTIKQGLGGGAPTAIGGYAHVIIGGATFIFTNMPAAVTELPSAGARRSYADLSHYTSCRAFVTYNIAGFAGSVLRVQYTTDLTGVAGWADLTPNVAIDGSPNTLGLSAIGAIPTGARRPVLMRIVGEGGDAVVDPSFIEFGVVFT